MAAPYPNNCQRLAEQILGLKPMTSVRRSDPCPLRRTSKALVGVHRYAWSCRLAASALVPRLRSCLSLAPFLSVSRYLAVSSVVSRFQPSDRRTGEPTCAGGETRYLAKYPWRCATKYLFTLLEALFGILETMPNISKPLPCLILTLHLLDIMGCLRYM